MSDLARNESKPTDTAVHAAVTADPAHGDALEAMFARYQDELLGTLFYLVGNIEDARDALQDSFIKCWRHRHKLDEVRNPRAWIFRIALNTGRDLRATAWRRKRQNICDEESIEQSGQLQPDAILARSEQLKQLQAAISRLRTEEQEVFLLRQDGELTYEEIAETLEIPTGTVKTRMRLAVAHLRKQLHD